MKKSEKKVKKLVKNALKILKRAKSEAIEVCLQQSNLGGERDRRLNLIHAEVESLVSEALLDGFKKLKRKLKAFRKNYKFRRVPTELTTHGLPSDGEIPTEKLVDALINGLGNQDL